MAGGRVRSSSLTPTANVGRQFRALIHVQDVPQEEFSEHGATVPFGGMKRDQRLVHAVVCDAVGTSVQPPSTLANVPRPFADHNPQTRGPAVQDPALNHLFAPRPRSGHEDDVSVGKPVLGKPPPVLCFKHNDVITKETPLNAGFEVKQRDASHHKPLL